MGAPHGRDKVVATTVAAMGRSHKGNSNKTIAPEAPHHAVQSSTTFPASPAFIAAKPFS